MTLEAVDND